MTEARTDPDLLFVGTYTESSYLVRMDRRSGELLKVGSVGDVVNVRWMTTRADMRREAVRRADGLFW
jgi:hypothetical protein